MPNATIGPANAIRDLFQGAKRAKEFAQTLLSRLAWFTIFNTSFQTSAFELVFDAVLSDLNR